MARFKVLQAVVAKNATAAANLRKAAWGKQYAKNAQYKFQLSGISEWLPGTVR